MSEYSTFSEFYPHYLSEHRHPVNRRLHFLGSTCALVLLIYALYAGAWWAFAAAALVGYGCAWVGHFFFERNKPATFRHPLYSFLADWVMYKDILTRRVPW